MNYFLYVIGVAAILVAVALLFTLFNREAQVTVMTPLAAVAAFVTGIVMCALGRIIGLLKQIARSTARNDITSQF